MRHFLMASEDGDSIIAIIDQKVNIQEYKQRLIEKGKLNTTALLTTPLSVLAHTTSVPIDVCQQILDAITDTIVQDPVDVIASAHRPRFNDPILDNVLRIPDGAIFELSGRAGAGKSTLVYQMAVNERIFDMSKRVLLICTEKSVSTERLWQIAQNRMFSATEIMNGISISNVDSVDKLNELIQEVIPVMLQVEGAVPPSMIIIDSIAALFRTEYDMSLVQERSMLLFDMATTLKWLSSTYNALVVITNQATANITPFGTGSEWMPALGMSWSNCVNVRVLVSKTQTKHEIDVGDRVGDVVTGPNGETIRNLPRVVPIRKLFVEISPVVQDVQVQFYVDNDGVHGV